MSVYETSITNPKKQLEFYKQLSEQLQQENEQLKLINKEYERLDNGNKRGFKITSVKQYNIDELVRCKNNWNKLKEIIDVKLYNTEYLQKLCGCKIDGETHIILDIIKNEMQELEERCK